MSRPFRNRDHICRLLLCALLALLARGRCNFIKYNTTSARHPDKLNVHIICHSHDDAGWLKTVDQYYLGANQSIQVAGVQDIFDTVMLALQQNPDRRFMLMEQAFFARWWDEQSPDTQRAVHDLFGAGQLAVWGGGWVQHDEAAAHYVAMIDQTTRGHKFLKDTFGYIPRVGLQADPFGHSATQAALLSGALGFDAVIFGRADYQDVAVRRAIKATEMVWRGAASYGKAADVFTVNLDGYWPVPGFWWDWGGSDEGIHDNPRLSDYNMHSRIDDFVARATERFAYTRGNDIMLTMGSDFHYSNAFHWYKNLDKLIHYANLDGRLNVFYSTADDYVAAKHGYGTAWPLKTDDFLPYADNPHGYWTGYFSSRPTSKAFIRAATSYLQAARQLDLLASASAPRTGSQRSQRASTTDALEAAVSLTQHHDAITGTAKQHVVNDYHQRLAAGMATAVAGVNAALEALISGEQDHPEAARRRLAAVAGGARGPPPVSLSQCPYLNASICGPTVGLSRLAHAFAVVVYNPLAWPRSAPVRVPLTVGAANWTVVDADGAAVAAQLVPVSARTVELQQAYLAVGAVADAAGMADHDAAFIAELPPLGYAVFTFEPSHGSLPTHATYSQVVAAGHSGAASARAAKGGDGSAAGGVIQLSNEHVTIEVDEGTGRVVALAADGTRSRMAVEFVWYRSSDGRSERETSWQASGAYIFRPQGGAAASPVAGEGALRSAVVRGQVVSELRQQHAEWAHLTLRLWAGARHVEVEWTVGPIPIDDRAGKEVALRYSSGLESGDVYYTDSNGREMLARTRDARPTWEWQPTEPVSGNYYPLSAAMYIAGPTGEALALVTDRAQGGASLAAGEMETMVHRRTLFDDNKGVGEALNETECGCRDCHCAGLTARGVQYLALSSPSDAARQRRTLQQLLNDPPLLAFGAVPNGADDALLRRRYSGMGEGDAARYGLPPNVHLLTLQRTGERTALIRLAHLYQVDEDRHHNLSAPATVDLQALLPLRHGGRPAIHSVSELSLSTNQCAADVSRLRFAAGEPLGNGSAAVGAAVGGGGGAWEAPLGCGVAVGGRREGVRVVLAPMQVRTFEVEMS